MELVDYIKLVGSRYHINMKTRIGVKAHLPVVAKIAACCFVSASRSFFSEVLMCHVVVLPRGGLTVFDVVVL